MKIHHLHLPRTLPLSYHGPDVKEGPLPALFYLSLAAEDSLNVDPFNQPTAYLAPYPLRIFSVNLPAHGPGLSPLEALHTWAVDIESGHNVLGSFIDQMTYTIEHLIQEGILDPERLAIAGLSRGALFAAHLAARIPQIPILLGFAPLIQLSYAKEFQNLQQHPLVHSLNLDLLVEKLVGKKVRFYIGNRDTRVGTERCFQFVQALAEANFQNKLRTPPVEMIITPSIGFQGHGTSKEAFEDGARWVGKQLGVIDGA